MGHSQLMSTLTSQEQAESLETGGEQQAPGRARVPAIVWRAFWSSRLVVLLSGMFAVVQFGLSPGYSGFDQAGLTTPFGYFGNLLAAPFARWDSVWYLTIARFGYQHQLGRTAFFPLYPALIHVFGVVLGSDLIAGVVISLVCFAVALILLHRLVLLDFSEEIADTTVLLVAFFPASFFFSAIYTESLFLMLSLGCILQARKGRWWAAGVLGGLAASSRNGGVLLALPSAILFLYGPRADARARQIRWAAAGRSRIRALLPRYRLSVEVLWLALIPAGLAGYLVYTGITAGNWLDPFHAESLWYHRTTNPFTGAWDGAVAAWDGLRQLLHGPPPPLYFQQAGGNPMQVAGQNLMLFSFLLTGLIACVGALRTLPFAYGAYALVGLALPLSDPVIPQPLSSFPRYMMVLFPLFIWAAGLLVRRRWTTVGVATGAVLLGVFTAEFATWRFVA
jgi:hypothetical protein